MASRFNPVAAVAHVLERDDMALLGVGRTTRIARAYNSRRMRPSLEYRQRNAARHLVELREAAGEGALEFHDGWVRDDSGSLPHLEEVVDDMRVVIEERAGRLWEDYRRPWFRNILPPDAVERFPSLLDFAISARVLYPVVEHVGYLPVLSEMMPRGVRLIESSTQFDPQPNGPWRSSQLYHLDYHASPTIYVIVALRDITPDDGPLHFIGQRASQRVAEEIGYFSRRVPYRISDEQMYSMVDEAEVHSFTGPAGSVLFIDATKCFHFGSRAPASPRFHLQYAYTSPVRNDFNALLRWTERYPTAPGDAAWRRLVKQPKAVE